MEPDLTRELSVPLRYRAAPVRTDGLSTVDCLNCRQPLDIHQPDADLPDRMLGTCPACQTWHLLDCDPGSKLVVVVVLPDFTPFRKGLGSG
ncbi:MAG: hypothetical protein LC745_11735 [Planctomycetia bacterium]|nr:hypothetical protein [Planctomycetia bacterium]